MSIEAMKQALEALESCDWNAGYMGENQYFDDDKVDNAITSLRQAIAEAEKQEPVAMQMDVIVVNLVREGINKHRARELAEHFVKHTHPPKREWVGLTDGQIRYLQDVHDVADTDYAHAIEAKLKEKNT